MIAQPTATTIGEREHATPHPGRSVAGLVRCALRSVGFALVLVAAAADYGRARCFHRRVSLHWRANWLRRWSRIVARLIGLQLNGRGSPPGTGMIVSNHLSYLDIIAYSALVPCVFVAKSEVASWPVLGRFSRMAGTIFVDRTRRMEVAEVNRRVTEALQAGRVVVLFAEGTSSDGRSVLPFHASLLEPARNAHCAIVPAAIQYRLDGGSVSDEVCYWRDMTLLPHLLNLFANRKVRAFVAFGTSSSLAAPCSRKETALRLHQCVVELRTSLDDAERKNLDG